jgi:hypothetical protein
MMLIELKKDMYLQEIVNDCSEEFTKECKGNNFVIDGFHFNSNKYLLAYYDYTNWWVAVRPLNYYELIEYKKNYKKHLIDIETFVDVDFTLDILIHMNLTKDEAALLFKDYKEKFEEEEEYELLNYLITKSDG